MKTQSVKRVYNVYSHFYEFLFGLLLSPRIRFALSNIEFAGIYNILEVGIGTGLSIKHYPLDKNTLSITGIDISCGMLKKAIKKRDRYEYGFIEGRGYLKIDFLAMDASNLAFKDNSFDLIFAAFTLSVIPDLHCATKEFRRVLKRGGKLVAVNHFLSENRIVGQIERLLNPYFKPIGWRMDTSVSEIYKDGFFKPLSSFKKTKIDPWRVIIAEVIK